VKTDKKYLTLKQNKITLVGAYLHGALNNLFSCKYNCFRRGEQAVARNNMLNQNHLEPPNLNLQTTP
jgi:hypothetical protein